jgi:hypothetical protein
MNNMEYSSWEVESPSLEEQFSQLLRNTGHATVQRKLQLDSIEGPSNPIHTLIDSFFVRLLMKIFLSITMDQKLFLSFQIFRL